MAHAHHGMPATTTGMMHHMHTGGHAHTTAGSGIMMGTAAGGHHGHGHDTGMSNMHGMGHMMYFTATTNSVILFRDWETNSTGTLIGAMVGIFFFAFFFEGVRTARDVLASRASRAALRRAQDTKSQKPVRWSVRDSVIQILMHMLFFTWSYMLMLIFMTFNVYVCLAVVLGVGAGYATFLNFRPQFQSNPNTDISNYRPSEDECCV